MSLAYIALIGLLTGLLGTGLGGILVIFIGRPKPRGLSYLLGLAAGVMVSIVLIDLLPEAVDTGSFLLATAGLLGGALFTMLLDLLVPHIHMFEGAQRDVQLVKAGVVLSLGIALHNFPEGIAIGAGFVADPQLGFTLALLIAVHNIPEGMALAAPLYAGGVTPGPVVLAAALAGLPIGAGAYLGAVVGALSTTLLSLGLGFAAGAMLYITFHELVPEANRVYSGRASTIGLLSGVILGLLLTSAI